MLSTILITGTFLGMKPCGIILFGYELFISESKTQVYGLRHDVFAKWELNEIGNYVKLFILYVVCQLTSSQ